MKSAGDLLETVWCFDRPPKIGASCHDALGRNVSFIDFYSFVFHNEVLKTGA